MGDHNLRIGQIFQDEDSVYFHVDDMEATDFVEISCESVILDLDEHNNIVGIEFRKMDKESIETVKIIQLD